MKRALKLLGGLLVLVLLVAAGGYLWASISSSRMLSVAYEAHAVDFPIPFPLGAEEAATLNLDGAAGEQLALSRALERGRHLATVRYACAECHGENLAGGTMIDAFPIGTLLGPNITRGSGSRVLQYRATDWDRIVRHGILPDGRPSLMPSQDFQRMSDQELSDIVAYARSLPPVDSVVPERSLGPLGKVLLATGQLQLSAQLIAAHDQPHRRMPPPPEVTLEFGGHLAATCVGCHRRDYSGGPIAGGDPSWPPARNLTPHATALGGWSYDDFLRAMRESVRPDGTAIAEPMTWIAPAAQQMTDVEMQALWLYLRALPAIAPAN